MYLQDNQLTSFDGTGLSSLTELDLRDNQLTEFDGTGLSSLTTLDLSGNPLTTFIGGDMGLITSLNFGPDSNGGWNITTLESFDGTGLSSLTELYLGGNQLTSLDVTPMVNLSQLILSNNLITPQNWDSILSGLVGLGNEDGNLKVGTTQRTNASTADYNTLVSRNWVINGTFEIYTPPTFITSKLTGETINIYVETSTGYWKYNHNGTDFGPFNQNDGQQSAEVLNERGEFTIISWDNDNEEVGGDVTYLDLNNNQLSEFDGTGLSSLTGLNLGNNQLTTLGISNMDYLQYLFVDSNLLTPSVNNSLLVKLAANELSNDWNYGRFYTTGGRTSAGTGDYDTLISRGWIIEGADLVSAVRKLRVKGVGQLNP